jgi:2-polyprenyl-3-methyl-5-hydroxy-6-metoxy-1,4-benzoquinol methylase
MATSHAALEREQGARAEVERAAGHYYHTPLQMTIDNRTRRFLIERCLPYFRGPKVLELGYVDGLWTDELLRLGLRVDVVEGALRHVRHAREKYAAGESVRVFHSLFQEYVPDGSYDTILAGDMLRYLPDPAAFLRGTRAWLNDGGVLIATLPNSRSLHRRIGTLLGMEDHPASSNTRDREVGNLRTYDRYEFRALLRAGGYDVEVLRGCFLKPLSSEQIADWDDALLRAFADVGEELQDYCWFMYAVCKKASE